MASGGQWLGIGRAPCRGGGGAPPSNASLGGGVPTTSFLPLFSPWWRGLRSNLPVSGSGRMFVIEADESDKSFLNYPVDVAFITNVDFDHPDFFSGRDAYEDAFVEFATAARDAVVICLDDPGGRRVRARLTHRRVVGYGFAADADLRLLAVDASGPAASAAVCFAGQEHKVRLRVPGRHNAYNAVGALAVLTALACPPIPQGFA